MRSMKSGMTTLRSGMDDKAKKETDYTRPPQASSHPPTPRLPRQASFHGDAPLPVPGDFVKVEITDAAAYDLVGRIVG